MANKFCANCNRNVGVVKRRSTGTIISIVLFIILGLIVPFWFFSLPFFWGLAFLVFVFSGKKTCNICAGTMLSELKVDEGPAESPRF